MELSDKLKELSNEEKIEEIFEVEAICTNFWCKGYFTKLNYEVRTECDNCIKASTKHSGGVKNNGVKGYAGKRGAEFGEKVKYLNGTVGESFIK